MRKLKYEDLEDFKTRKDFVLVDIDLFKDCKSFGVFESLVEILSMSFDMYDSMLDDKMRQQLKEELEAEQESPSIPYDFRTGTIKDGEINSFGSGNLSIPRNKKEAEEVIDNFNIRLVEKTDKEYDIIKDYMEELG